MTWTPSIEFVESDVIEWTETIWPPNNSRRKRKQRPWGKQKVTVQITAIEGNFIKLTVLKSEIVENTIGLELRAYKIGSTITKKRSTLQRGAPELLLWSEEDVRKATTSPSSPT